MLHTSLIITVLGLLVTVISDHTEIVQGTPWLDFLDCDHDEWEFDNPNPVVHARHRDGGNEELVDSCHYGEWGDNNLWGYIEFDLRDINLNPLNNALLRIESRVWGFCDFESNDRVWISFMDEYDSNNDQFDRSREIWSSGKNSGNCVGWDVEVPDDLNRPDWLDEVSCTNGASSSCYTDVDITVPVNGDHIRLRYNAQLNSAINNEGWAYSNIRLQIVGDIPVCCTGQHRLPGKSCSSLHEQFNCEAKDCNWNEEEPLCQRECCRKKDQKSKEKPKCKNTNYDLNICRSERDDCEIRNCDLLGFWDGWPFIRPSP